MITIRKINNKSILKELMDAFDVSYMSQLYGLGIQSHLLSSHNDIKVKIYDLIKRNFLSNSFPLLLLNSEPTFLDYLFDNWDRFVSMHQIHFRNRILGHSEKQEFFCEWLWEEHRKRDSCQTESDYALKLNNKFNVSLNLKILLSTIPQFYKDKSGRIQRVTGQLTGLPVSASFGKSYSVLQDKLLSRTTIREMLDRLSVIANEDPSFNEVLKRLGIEEIEATGTWMSADKALLAAQFEQAFRKSRTNYVFFFIDKFGRIRMNDATEEGAQKTIYQRFKAQSEEMDDKIFITKNGKRYYKPELRMRTASPFDRRKLSELTDFLKSIGIDLDVSSPFIDPKDRDYLETVVEAINTSIKSGNQVDLFDENSYTDHRWNMKYLVKMKMAESLDYIESSHYNMNGDLVFDNTLFSEVTLIEELLNRDYTFEEIKKYFPELENSLYLQAYAKNPRKYEKSGESDLPIKIFVAEGILEGTSRESVEFKKLPEQIRLSVAFSMYKQNMFPLLRPADNSVERFVKFSKVFPNPNDYIKDRFIRELEQKFDTNKKSYINFDANFSDGILLSLASFDAVKGVVKENLKEELRLYFSGKMTVQEFMNKNWEIYRSNIERNLRHYAEELKELYIQNGLLQKITDKDGTVSYKGIGIDLSNSEYKDGEDDVETPTVLHSTLYHYVQMNMVQSIEQFNLFFGDPRGYKSVEDMFKRFAGAVGTKRSSSVSPEIDKAVEKMTDRSVLSHEGAPVIRTFTFDDVMVVDEALVENYHESFGLNDPNLSKEEKQFLLRMLAPFGKLIDVEASKDGKEKLLTFNEYKKMKAKGKAVKAMEEGDGGGYVSWEEWRTMKFRSGDWSFGIESLEALYQWEKYEMEDVSHDRRFYVDPFTKEVSKKPINPRKLPVANPLKPQYFGPNTEGIHTMFKMSVLPLQPSLIKNTNLEKLHNFMIKNRVGIAAHYSANKGISTKLKPNGTKNTLYDAEGNFRIEMSPVFQEIFYKFYGIQLDTGNKVKHKVITGTQMMKQMLSNLFEAGVAVSEKAGEHVRKYLDFNDRRIELGKKLLMDKLGLVYNKGNYFIRDTEAFLIHLQEEADNRDLPDNVREGIELLKDSFLIDGLPNRASIEGLLNGMADSMVISQKRNGGAYYQEPSSFFEFGVTRKNQVFEGKAFKASNLKFYTNSDGKVTSMEVYLPDIYKGRVPIGSNSDLLKIIGFRIPTQGLNSIESIVVKGFLPESAGELIIMPSAIVAKAGSDYDIDKLNLYFPNYYVDRNGNAVYIDPKKSLTEQYEDYKDVFKNKFNEKEFDRFTDSLWNVEITIGHKNYLKGVIESYLESASAPNLAGFGIFLENEKNNTDREDRKEFLIEVMESIEVNNPDFSKLIPMSQTEFELKYVENGIAETQHEILLDPDNFKQLVTPDSSFILKELSEKIAKPRGKAKLFEATIKTFQSEIEKRYLVGNQAIGIAALASTFHIMSQLSGLRVAGSFVSGDQFSTKVNLKHHRDDQGNIVLGKNKDADGKYTISQILSQWITAAVDAAKDPFMFDLNATTETLPIILMLTSMGVPMETTAYFMNQPTIKEFMRLKAIHQSPIANENGTSLKDKAILSKLLNGFGTEKDLNMAVGTKELTLEDLKSQIDQPLNIRNATQVQALKDFYRYMKLSQKFSEAIQGTTFDTKSVGKNYSENALRLEATDKVLKEKLFIGYDNLMQSGFISPYHKAAKSILEMQSDWFLQTRDHVSQGMFEGMVKFVSNLYATTDEKVKILDRFRLDFITFILKTNNLEINGYKDPVNISNIEKSLYTKVGEYVTKKITEAKNEKLAGRSMVGQALFEALIPVKNEDMINVRGIEKSLTTIESNAITEAWSDLYEADPSKGMGILLFLIAQSGLQGSTTNFIKWAPADMMHNLLKAAMVEESKRNETMRIERYQKFLNEFFVSNYDMNHLVPKAEYVNYEDMWILSWKVKDFPVIKKFIPKKGFKETDEVASKKAGKSIWETVPLLLSGDNRSIFTSPVKPVVKNHRGNYTRNGYGNIFPYLRNGVKQKIIDNIKWSPKKNIIRELPKDAINSERFNTTIREKGKAAAFSTYPLDLFGEYFVQGYGNVRVTGKRSHDALSPKDQENLLKVMNYESKEEFLQKNHNKLLKDAVRGNRHIYAYVFEKSKQPL